jgi:DNA-binding protein Alba
MGRLVKSVVDSPGSEGDENVVYVGRKPVFNYVLAVMNNLQRSGKVTLKARGTNISRAVDVAEVARHRFITDLIQIYSESYF